jgi:hypothetical protein
MRERQPEDVIVLRQGYPLFCDVALCPGYLVFEVSRQSSGIETSENKYHVTQRDIEEERKPHPHSC